MIKAYFFDLVGPLLDIGVFAKIYPQVLNSVMHEKKVSPIDLNTRINQLKKGGEKRVDTYDLCELYDCLGTYYDILSKNMEQNESLLKLFHVLHEMKKFTYIATDCHQRTASLFLDKNNISVDGIFCFENCGMKDERYWKKIIEKTGHNPEDCMFIDDEQENLNVADSFGIKTLLTPRLIDFSVLKHL